MTTPPHPLVSTARSLAESLLAPHAARVDQEGVPAGHIEAIKRSGLLGVSAPKEYGGAGAPDAVAREIMEILAGACCSTWFVQTQHHTPVKLLAQSELPVRERLLRPMASGELLAGIAFAHVRAFPRVPVRATAERGGWRFDGTVPWYTGWGLNDVMLLAGVTDADEIVFAFTEARQQPGLRPSPPMRLAALTAARTVSLDLDGLWLPDESVVLRTPHEKFALVDRPRNTNASPAVFGVAYAALDVLEEAGETETARAVRGHLDGAGRARAPGRGTTAGLRPGRTPRPARARRGTPGAQDTVVRPDARGHDRRDRGGRRPRHGGDRHRPTPRSGGDVPPRAGPDGRGAPGAPRRPGRTAGRLSCSLDIQSQATFCGAG